MFMHQPNHGHPGRRTLCIQVKPRHTFVFHRKAFLLGLPWGVLAMVGEGSADGVVARADSAAESGDDGKEELWRRWLAKRRMAIETVIGSSAYRALHKPVPGPDPSDRTIRKHEWERLLTAWQDKIRLEYHRQMMKQINALDLKAPAGHGLPHYRSESRQRKQDQVHRRFENFLVETGRRKQPEERHQRGSTVAAST